MPLQDTSSAAHVGPDCAPRVSFHTLGCRLNQAETALIAEGFRQRGYAVVDHGDVTEVAVINTCSVTERADAQCRREIRRIRRIAPEAIVCAVGCYAQAETDTVAAIMGVDYIVGTDRKFQLASLLEDGARPVEPVIDVSRRPDMGAVTYDGPGYYPSATRANIKIQDGCDFTCAFCILPRIRGHGRSRRLGDIIAEAHELARRGHREIVIAGVNIGSYAFEGFTVADVAKEIEAIDDVARVRVSSIEPTTVGHDLLEWMATSPKACRHLHLPLQSGSDAILAAMKRKYTTADYAAFAERATAMIPDLGLGTDIIVGFPGETDKTFEESKRFIESLPFSYLHVFSYSERPKTAAVHLTGKVRPQAIKDRCLTMRAVSDGMKAAFYERHIGRTMDVLFETVDSDGHRKGWTGNYIRVAADPEAVGENDIRGVALTGIASDFCLSS